MNTDKEERPWGDFKRFTLNEVSTVKILTINPKGLLSYQLHKNRDEFWRIINGKGYAIHNDERIEMKTGDELFIARGDKHRFGSEEGAQILEISFGEFDEQEEERLDDAYGREGTRG